MFERFTKKARAVVVRAQHEVRERGASSIGSEHVLLALYAEPESLAVTVLDVFGVRKADVEAAVPRGDARPTADDAEALAALGIDLDEVRQQVERAFGPGALDRTAAAREKRRGRFGGHVPFEPGAKKVLELALREAIRMGHDYIGTEHILLGMLHPGTGRAHDILAARDVRQDAARVIVEEMVRRRRAG